LYRKSDAREGLAPSAYFPPRAESFKERLANAFRIWFRHMLPLARAVLKVLDTTQGALNAEEPELRRRA
jgi:hypothetical protein